MYFVTANQEIIPFRYDYGQDLFVVDFRDADEDMVYDIVECNFDDEMHHVLDVEVVETTRRVFVLDVVLDSDDDSESSDGAELSDDSEDDYGDSSDNDSEEADENDEHHRHLLAQMGHLEV